MSERTELTIETARGSLATVGDTNMLVETLRPADAAGVNIRLTVVGAPGAQARAVTVVPEGDSTVVRFGRPNDLGQITFRGLSREAHRVTVLPEVRSGRAVPAFPLPAAQALAATQTAARRLGSADGRTAVELVTVGRVLWAVAALDRDCVPGEVVLLRFECAADSEGTTRRLIIALGAQPDGDRLTGTVRVGDPVAQDWFDVRAPVGPEHLHELAAVGSDPEWRAVVEASVAAAAYPADHGSWRTVLNRIPDDGMHEPLRAVVRDAVARW